MITLTWQSVVSVSAFVAAVVLLLGYTAKVFNWFQKQKTQDEDIQAIKKEQALLTYGILACLKGLKEQGCNGPVTDAIEKIDKHLNEKAHE